MTVNPTRQSFMCFACQTGGDALSFVMKYENIGFVDAIRKLADRAGVVLVEERHDPQEERKKKRGKSLVEVNKMAAEYFHAMLRKSPLADHARGYLNSRGFGNEMAARWQVGWAPEASASFLKWAASKNITEDLLEESGLASRNEGGRLYARFRDRLMFPINNDRGECVGFSGRVLKAVENTGKYVNSPETPVFRKSQICFGLDRAQAGIRESGRVLVCEGQVDVIACHEAGVGYAVASLGTAFTPEHARLLKRRTDKAVLCFDSDAAGVKAADRAFKAMAAEGMEVLMAVLPKQGDDPDSFIKREGREAFQQVVDGALPFLASRVARGWSEGKMRDAGSAASFALDIADLIASIKDPVTRDMAASDAATRLQTGLEVMRRAVQTALKQQQREQARGGRNGDSVTSGGPVKPMPVDRAVQVACMLALQDRKVQALIAERIEDLVEPMDVLPGGVILRQILEKLPNPEEPSEFHLFLRGLPEDQAAAVKLMNVHPFPVKEPEKAVEEACAGLSNVALEKQLNSIMASLKNPNLPDEQRLKLMKKSVDLRNLLSSILPRMH